MCDKVMLMGLSWGTSAASVDSKDVSAMQSSPSILHIALVAVLMHPRLLVSEPCPTNARIILAGFSSVPYSSRLRSRLRRTLLSSYNQGGATYGPHITSFPTRLS